MAGGVPELMLGEPGEGSNHHEGCVPAPCPGSRHAPDGAAGVSTGPPNGSSGAQKYYTYTRTPTFPFGVVAPPVPR